MCSFYSSAEACTLLPQQCTWSTLQLNEAPYFQSFPTIWESGGVKGFPHSLDVNQSGLSSSTRSSSGWNTGLFLPCPPVGVFRRRKPRAERASLLCCSLAQRRGRWALGVPWSLRQCLIGRRGDGYSSGARCINELLQEGSAGLGSLGHEDSWWPLSGKAGRRWTEPWSLCSWWLPEFCLTETLPWCLRTVSTTKLSGFPHSVLLISEIVRERRNN